MLGKIFLMLAIMFMVQFSRLQGSPIDKSQDEFIFINRPRQNDFDFKLIKLLLAGNESENAIISPFSVKVLLALLYEAAGQYTDTQRELASVLPSVSGTRLSRRFYNGVLRSLQEPSDEYDLKIATKIYVDSGIFPHSLFTLVANDSFFTPIERINFRAPTTCPEINRWVANATRDRITDLVKPESVADSVMIMLNAVYLKAYWFHPFPKFSTKYKSFFVRGGTKPLRTPFMMQMGSFFHHTSAILDAQILRLPYKGGRFAMTLLLPNNADASLDELIERLDSASLQDVQSKMRRAWREIWIPRFRFDYTAPMEDALKTLGIRKLFTNVAELLYLASGLDVAVSKVMQKAGIAVNEEGSTVIAATQIRIMLKMGESTPHFNANRPFVFLIEDETTGSMLFAGKVTHPEEFEEYEY